MSKSLPNDIVKQIQTLVSNWIGFESLLEKELHTLGNLVNEVTYVNPDRLTSIIGGQAIKLSRFTVPAKKKLNDKLEDLKLISNQMQEELKKVIVKYDDLIRTSSCSSSLPLSRHSLDDNQRPSTYINHSNTNDNNHNNRSAATCIEVSVIGRIVDDLKQQTLLEVSVINNIIITRVKDEWSCSDNSNGNMPDQNELITLLACFQYKPYLDESLLSRFMNLQVPRS